MGWNPLTWFSGKKEPKGSIPTSFDEPPEPPDNSHLEQRPSNNNEEAQTLSDIVRGISHAAASANEIQDQQFLKQLSHFFHREEDGTLVPKVVRTKIDDETFVEAPLISLIDPSTLGLEEMEVRMGVRLSKSEVKKRVHDVNKEKQVSRCSFNVALTGATPGSRQDVIDVTMKFKKAEPVEGVNRIIEEMNGLVKPSKYDDPNIKKPDSTTHAFAPETEEQNEFAPHDVNEDIDTKPFNDDEESSESSTSKE